MAGKRIPLERSILQSPWYWVYLFATGALICLVLMGPKFRSRQSQIERNYQGRNRAGQQAFGETPSGKVSTPDDTIVSLTPLYLLAGSALVVAWIGLLFTHFRKKNAAAKSEQSLE